MNNASLINRLKEVLTEGTWVTGTNLLTVIRQTQWPQANQSVKGLNSIAQLTFHLTYYMIGVNDVLAGQPLTIRDQFSFDMPPLQSEADWVILVDNFEKNALILIDQVSRLSSKELDKNFAYKTYGSIRRNINVLIEHSYYHLGQMVLIQKIVSA